MKKFLAILLIAIVACTTEPAVEEEAFDFEALLAKAVEFLKSTGLWEKAMNLLKSFYSATPGVDEKGEVQLKLPPVVIAIVGNLIVSIASQLVWEGGKWVWKQVRKVIGHRK